MAQPKTDRAAAVIPFLGSQTVADEDEIAIGLPAPASSQRQVEQPRPSVPDLGNSTKVWLLIGRGNTGKTTLIRYLAETVFAAGGRVLLADMDRTNATLSSYFADVHRPPDADDATVAKWLERLLTFVMTDKVGALIDLGGGDTTLRRLVTEIPDLTGMLDGAAIAPVAAYMVGPRPDDLAPLATLEGAGFHPPATVIVLNEGLTETPLPKDEAFSRVMRHSAFKAAVVRGAVPLWMPRLLPAAEIEARRIHFATARDAIVPEGKRQTPLGGFDRARVRAWLSAMDAEFGVIRSWLP
jgi:hypothetical protein